MPPRDIPRHRRAELRRCYTIRTANRERRWAR
jgi:hypothetical protein